MRAENSVKQHCGKTRLLASKVNFRSFDAEPPTKFARRRSKGISFDSVAERSTSWPRGCKSRASTENSAPKRSL
jgi:hypothetical protein